MSTIIHGGAGGGADTSLVTAGAADVLAPKVIVDANGNALTGTIPSKGAQTYTPGTANQSIAAGQYLSGAQTIAGDANLVSANIKAGKTIFGVAGNSMVVDTSAGNAVASDILSGKLAYVDGALVTGTLTPTDVSIYNTIAASATVQSTITTLSTTAGYAYSSDVWAPGIEITYGSLPIATDINGNSVPALSGTYYLTFTYNVSFTAQQYTTTHYANGDIVARTPNNWFNITIGSLGSQLNTSGTVTWTGTVTNATITIPGTTGYKYVENLTLRFGIYGGATSDNYISSAVTITNLSIKYTPSGATVFKRYIPYTGKLV